MNLSTATALLSAVATIKAASGFSSPPSPFVTKQLGPLRMGYLDDLSSELAPSPDPNPVPEEEDREVLKMSKEDLDRAGPGSWDSYVEFDEFDGGDGQMGVAGDGNKKLESFDMSQMAKSKTMSAKVAWGKSTGYADELVSKGMEQQKAQQLENWKNQQEVGSVKSGLDFA